MRPRYLLSVAIVLLLAVLVALAVSWLAGQLGSTGAGPPSGDQPASGAGAEPVDPVPDDAEAAIVDRVVDGDTVRIIASPDGVLPEGGSIRVRLLNIDAPERARDGSPATCGADAAAERLEQLVAPGDLVWLAADQEDRDGYDRPLRAMWTDDGTFVNELLAEEGHAEVVLIGPNDRFHDRIAAAAERARQADRGIRGARCGNRTRPLRRLTPRAAGAEPPVR